jgi:hypothetical protein
MKSNTKNTVASFFSLNAKGKLVLMAAFFLSSVGMMAQNKTTVEVPVLEIPATPSSIEKVKTLAVDSNVEFLNWFMGAKQSQTIQENTSSEGSTNPSKKKQIISSGVTPNKVLYRTLMKKVISQESAIA